MAVRNLPTPEGYALGAELARFAEQEIAKGKADKRCATCAFRKGTDANGCAPTLMDALKLAMERRPFYCHEAHKCCGGWRVLVADVAQEAPWDLIGGFD